MVLSLEKANAIKTQVTQSEHVLTRDTICHHYSGRW